MGTVKERELPEVNGKEQSYRKFWIVPQGTSSDCSRPTSWGSPASGCWGVGEIRFEQSPSGMWLSSRKKATSFRVPSAPRPPVAGKGWAEEVATGGLETSHPMCPLAPLLSSCPWQLPVFSSSHGCPAPLYCIPGSHRANKPSLHICPSPPGQPLL